jgi:hypothetical protein
MTDMQIMAQYQFDGMKNFKLSLLRDIFSLQFDSIVEDFIANGHDEIGYNEAWALWCRFE